LKIRPLTGHPPLVALLVPLFVCVASFGMMRPNATAVALAGILIGTLSVGGLVAQLVITRRIQPAEVHLSLGEPSRRGPTRGWQDGAHEC
jgi:hypothetical protein